MVFKEEFCAQVFLKFLRRLLRLVERQVYIMLDKHPVHRSREVKHWLDKNAHRIRVFFLPGCSPGLSPDELLNQDVKTNVGGRQRPRDQAQMLRSPRSYLRSRQRQAYIGRKYLREEHVRYAAT
jgi:transposase